MSAIATAIVVGGVGGSLISANSAKNAQQGANQANADIAARQSQDAYNAWLASRGISPGTTGLGTAGSAINTTLPLWSTINGQPTEQYLLQSILNRSGVGTDPNQWLTEANVSSYLSANPDVRAQIEQNLSGSGDSRTPEQWLYADLSEGDTNSDFISGVKAAHQTRLAASGIPSEYQSLQDAAVASAGKIFNGGYLDEELNALAPALAARRAAADLGFERNNEMRSRIEDIYGAEMTGADAYGNTAMDAANRVIAQNSAKRRLQGFSGGSSYDDVLRMRTLAPALNEGAQARATAGINRAKNLSSVLDTDVKIGQQNADLQNAIDRLQLVTGNINRQVSSTNLPAQLYSNQVQMGNLAKDASYSDIDALIKRLGLFSSGNSTPPTPTYAQVQPVTGTGQIAGQAISSVAGALGNYWSTKSLINAMGGGGLSSKGIPTGNTIW